MNWNPDLGEPTPCRCGEELLPPQCYLASGSSVLHSHGECRPESQPRDLEAELVAIRAKLAALVSLLVLGIVLAVLLAIVGSLAWLGASVGLGLR